jgi:hypothetical protein
MSTLDRVISPLAFRVSTAVTAVIAGWFALTFAFTVAGLLAGA